MKKIFLLIFSISILVSGEKKLSGNLKTDLLSNINFDSNFVDLKNNKAKNPILVGMTSFAIPGLGQYQTDRVLQSAIFSSIEIATISAIFYFDNLGEKKTIEFKKYADENWSVVRYAEWINIFGSEFGDSSKIRINSDLNLKPWERVNWSDLNKWESSLHSKGGFTHHLPVHGEQQYFELIGKYIQYKFGWKDYNYTGDALSSADLPKQIHFYMDERAKANQFFYKVKIASGILFVNHLISGIDAIYGTKKYNEKVSLNISIQSEKYFGFNNFYPTLNFKFRI